ncbi:MAG: glycosyltransferase [Cyanobacteria bacterium P01_B01_bin.77]
MKILHVIPSISATRGGPSQAILEMVKALHDLNLEVDVITTNDDGNGLLNVPICTWFEYQGVKIRFFSRFSPPINAVREFAFSVDLTYWLWNHIHEYDLLHIHGMFSYTSTSSMLVARAFRKPYLVGTHGVLCRWALQQSAMRKRVYLRLIERANLDKSAGFHVNSHKEKEEIDRLEFHCPKFLIPHGLNSSEIISDASTRLRDHYNLPADEPIFLFLARLHPVKGLEYLIQALANLKERRFTFILAGDGDELYEAHIQQYLKEQGLQKHVIMTGFVDGELKQLLLQGADLFVLTSYMENFGVAVLEALASGTPALVTSGVALATDVEQYGLGYVVPQEVNAISSALVQYLQLSEQQKNLLCRKAQKFVTENYTWDRIAANLSNVYQSVIEPRSVYQN